MTETKPDFDGKKALLYRLKCLILAAKIRLFKVENKAFLVLIQGVAEELAKFLQFEKR
jgi:hypothetical protein